MKIIIHSQDTRLRFFLPNFLCINSVLLNTQSKLMKKYAQPHIKDACGEEISFRLTAKEARRARRIIRKTRRKHPDWYLVDVRSSDGDTVRIKL